MIFIIIISDTSSISVSELGLHIYSEANLHGGFSSSANLSINNGGSLYVQGLLDLKGKFLIF